MDLASALRFAQERPDLLYSPGATCAAFLRSQARLRVARAANQVGKTIVGAYEANRHSLERPGSSGCVLVADLENHFAELCAKAWEVIARSELHPDCKYVAGKGFFVHGRRGVLYQNGSRWTFRSGKGEVMALAGATFDWLWVDEIPFESHFYEALRGIATKNARVWVTFTPIGRPVEWFRKMVEGDPDTGEKPEADWVQFNPQLAPAECPWRTPESIEEQIALCPPWERPQRIFGAWDGPTHDRTFSGFTDESVIPSVPEGDYQAIVAMDHGEGVGRQHALLVLYDANTVIAADEYVNDKATTPREDAAGVLAMLRRNRMTVLDVDGWVGDVNSAGKLGAGASVNEELERAFAQLMGLPPTKKPCRITKPSKGKGSVEYGERLLNTALMTQDLLVVARCKRLRKCLQHYAGDEDLKHGIDALRYGVQPILESRVRSTFSKLQLRYG